MAFCTILHHQKHARNLAISLAGRELPHRRRAHRLRALALQHLQAEIRLRLKTTGAPRPTLLWSHYLCRLHRKARRGGAEEQFGQFQLSSLQLNAASRQPLPNPLDTQVAYRQPIYSPLKI